MVSFAEEPGVASGKDELKSQSTDLPPQDYKQVQGFFDQLAKLISSDRNEQSEDSVPLMPSHPAESTQFSASIPSETASPPLKPQEKVVPAAPQEPPNPMEAEAAAALRGLLERLAPDQTEPETAALEGLLERLAPDQTEPETAALEELLERLVLDQTEPKTASWEGLFERVTEQLPPQGAMPITNEVEASSFSQLNTNLNQELSHLEAKVEASTQQTKRLLPVMADLLQHKVVKGKEKEKALITKRPVTFVGVGLLILGVILLPWGIYQYLSRNERRLEQKVAQALASAPELAVYRLEADVRGKTLQLTGKLPTRHLRRQAEQIAQVTAPGLALDDDIIVVDGSLDPVLVATQVQQVAKILNQIEGIAIAAHFAQGKVTLEGTALPITTVPNITQAFAQIPGVRSVSNQVKIKPSSIATRIYFSHNSATVKPIDSYIKVAPIKQLMQQVPSLQLKIIGYSLSTEKAGTQLALKRSQAVQAILEDLGIDRRRLQVIGRQGSPPDAASNQEQWLSRCVLFEIIQPSSETAQQ